MSTRLAVGVTEDEYVLAGELDACESLPVDSPDVIKGNDPGTSVGEGDLDAVRKGARGVEELVGVFDSHFKRIRLRSSSVRLSMGTRTWDMVSRSRMVTAWSSRESKSTVTQRGVPISSWRR